MKRLEDFTRADLAKFRKDVCLNGMFYSDFRNSFGIDEHSASLFFDSYFDFICELAAEDGFKWDYSTRESKNYPLKEGYHTFPEFLEKYDTTDNLEDWHGCYEDFSWVEYEAEEEDEMLCAA